MAAICASLNTALRGGGCDTLASAANVWSAEMAPLNHRGRPSAHGDISAATPGSSVGDGAAKAKTLPAGCWSELFADGVAAAVRCHSGGNRNAMTSAGARVHLRRNRDSLINCPVWQIARIGILRGTGDGREHQTSAKRRSDLSRNVKRRDACRHHPFTVFTRTGASSCLSETSVGSQGQANSSTGPRCGVALE